jgi:hypothetical protein
VRRGCYTRYGRYAARVTVVTVLALAHQWTVTEQPGGEQRLRYWMPLGGSLRRRMISGPSIRFLSFENMIRAQSTLDLATTLSCNETAHT